MKLLFLCFVVFAVSLCAWCQAPAGPAAHPPKPKVSPFAEYAGDWTATFEGKVWLRLHLELRGEQLIGALLHARSLSVNDNGDLKSVSEEESGATLTSAVLNPDGLLLTTKDTATQESDRYQMRLVTAENNTAELKMIAMSMPPGMPKPKPWRIVKSAVAAPSSAPRPR